MSEPAATLPRISFCTTCMGRLHHLKQTLRKNMDDNADYPNAEFVLLDYNSKDGLQDWVRENFKDEIASGKLKYIYYPEAEKFHMAHAKNMSHRLATGDILVNIDADNFTGKGFARWIADTVKKETTTAVKGRKTGVFLRPNYMEYALSGAGTAGRIAVPKEGFYAVGGYAERDGGWGADDDTFSAHLTAAGYVHKPIKKEFLSDIAHSDEERVANTGQNAETIRSDTVKRNLHRPKFGSNQGKFGCGVVYVNFSTEPTLVEPLAPVQNQFKIR